MIMMETGSPGSSLGNSLISIEIGTLILIAVFALCALMLVILIRGIAGIIAENKAIRLDAAALVAGDLMPREKKRRMAKVKKRTGGLRLKLVFFTTVLALVVNVLSSFPLYLLMTRNQSQTLFQGLWDRSTVLLEGLAANAQSCLFRGDIADMSRLPGQMASIPEALYVTITGYNPDTLVFEDQVWATNDPSILGKIDTAELIPGYSRISDALSLQVKALSSELNALAMERVGGFPEAIAGFHREIRELTEQPEYVVSAEYTDSAHSASAALRLDEIQITLDIYESRITDTLARIGGGIISEPHFSLANAEQHHRYLFYKPVMLRLGAEDSFFWGVVRVEVSINAILGQIDAERNMLFRVNLLFFLAAQAIGVIGALVLSNLIIKPIRKLVRHVEIIRDAEDLAALGDMDIKLKSRDELAILGDTVNDMTRGLVKAAQAASELSIGKEFQKRFIPLELDEKGNKLSSGFEETTYLSLFGYYEGAKDVSGDYFDYQDLDGRYYAVIKCDVAGKGVPASFIMIQVATMFLNYFKHWKPTKEGMHIENLAYQINEFIETLAFKDRFAAFTLCLYDSHTGTARFCNAGDNLVHLYDASEKRLKTLALPETPAAGVLPNFLVESKGGYKVQSITLDHGDMLLLFTDGIEEAKRTFRNAAFKEIQCAEGSRDTPHGNHVAGQAFEELGYDRVEEIVNAVMSKKTYTLRKWHNGEGDAKDLQFDFRSSQGGVEEVIMAMISIEKMFRCYYNPKATEENRVLVDRIVDAFLKKHFLQYRNYCSFTQENPGNTAYMYYTHVMEDEQYDDLTILGIKRK